MLRLVGWGQILWCLGVSVSAQTTPDQPRPPRIVPLHGKSVVRFATVAEGAKAISRQDRFIQALSPFDKQARLGTDQEVSREQFLNFVKEHVVEWPDDQVRRLSLALASVRERMKAFKIPFPKTVLLVKTTGKEEGGAAYCRGNAIVLPQNLLNPVGRRMERLLIHELFHILSVHNEKLRNELYQIIGFRPCPAVKLPKDLASRKITNPDAPTLEHYIELKIDNQSVKAVPLLFASIPRYDAKKGGSFFRYLKFRLMIVEEGEAHWRPVLRAGQPILYEPKKVASFLKQIGANTDYIYHPDEILADNFVLLINRTGDLKNPEIVEQMGKLLKEGRMSNRE